MILLSPASKAQTLLAGAQYGFVQQKISSSIKEKNIFNLLSFHIERRSKNESYSISGELFVPFEIDWVGLPLMMHYNLGGKFKLRIGFGFMPMYRTAFTEPNFRLAASLIVNGGFEYELRNHKRLMLEVGRVAYRNNYVERGINGTNFNKSESVVHPFARFGIAFPIGN